VYFPGKYLDLSHADRHSVIFEGMKNVWEAISDIGTYLHQIQPGIKGKVVRNSLAGKQIYVGKGTHVESGAVIKGPAWIGENCEIRHGCYIRENVIICNRVVLGNSCELKNCLILDDAHLPHFNYAGDSIIGYKAHLGAGAILSNVRLSAKEVWVRGPDGKTATGLRKFGAILGDYVKIGCNSVLNPGSIIGRRSILYPGCQWSGVLPAFSTVRLKRPSLEIFIGDKKENR